MKIKVAALQTSVEQLTERPLRERLWHLEETVGQLVGQGVGLLLLPELWHCGLVESRKEAAVVHDTSRDVARFLERLSSESGITICGGLLTGREGELFNTLCCFTPRGERFQYDKIHLFPPFGEPEVFTAGRQARAFALPVGQEQVPVGTLVCYDLRFPELSRELSRQGALLFLVSALWPQSRIENFVHLARSRALENQAFVLAANAAGRQGEVLFGGSSLCCSPDGRIIRQAGPKGGELVCCEVDLEECGRRRRLFDSSRPREPWRIDTEGKLASLEEAVSRAGILRAGGGKLVFTNGCFDILHAGHVTYLEEARAFGDFLVVGLNSDASISRIKGPERPVNRELHRARVLSALACVDMVVIFDEDTPEKLIHALSPDVLVKGADWSEDQIVGADFVKARGGRVERIAFKVDESTTSIISRIGKGKS